MPRPEHSDCAEPQGFLGVIRCCAVMRILPNQSRPWREPPPACVKVLGAAGQFVRLTGQTGHEQVEPRVNFRHRPERQGHGTPNSVLDLRNPQHGGPRIRERRNRRDWGTGLGATSNIIRDKDIRCTLRQRL